MKRREFVVSSAAGSFALFGTHLPFAGMSSKLFPPPAATRKILIAGGNYVEPFVRYMASLTGKKRPRLCYLPTASADRTDGITRLVQDLCAARRRAVRAGQLHREHDAERRAGTKCCCRWTASSRRAATRSISRRSGRRRASTSCCGRRGTAASSSAARAPARCAGSRRARRIRGRKSCRP